MFNSIHLELNIKASSYLMSYGNGMGRCFINAMAEAWENQTFGSINSLKYIIAYNLKCQFITEWKNELNNMSSCNMYLQLKPNFQMEKCLTCLNKKQRIAISRYRINIKACLLK